MKSKGGACVKDHIDFGPCRDLQDRLILFGALNIVFSYKLKGIPCSLGTVMSRLFYARKKLQEQLHDVYETSL